MLAIENISKYYDDLLLLDKVNYRFENNGLNCIVGSLGSGKTLS